MIGCQIMRDPLEQVLHELDDSTTEHPAPLFGTLSLRMVPYKILPVVQFDGSIFFCEWGIIPALPAIGMWVLFLILFGLMIWAEVTSPVQVFGGLRVLITVAIPTMLVLSGAVCFCMRKSRWLHCLQGGAGARWEWRRFGRVVKDIDVNPCIWVISVHDVRLRMPRESQLIYNYNVNRCAVIVRTLPFESAMCIAVVSTRSDASDFIESLPPMIRTEPTRIGAKLIARRL